jgi:NADH:ubiquinone oxidoreductase subunit F (NADH-binding)
MPDGTLLGSPTVPIPEAHVRAAASFYEDHAHSADLVRLCAGTSCLLCGASAVADAAASAAPCRRVSCLGYCDRAPAILRPDGGVIVHAAAETVGALLHGAPGRPAPPEIRCASRSAIVTRRIGRGDHSPLATARADGAYEALRAALRRAPAEIIATIEASGERGRGGAAFPTGLKWRRCAEADGLGDRFVVANGDEGDPGAFIDRVLMELDPHGVLEGLAIAAYAVGARRGIVFVRSEYPEAQRRMRSAIDEAARAGILGPSVLDTAFALDVTVVAGMGSYVCGEETALLNAIEGRRGEVRIRPPYPAERGLFGRPTVVDNVETLVNVPWIVEHGAAEYARLGTKGSAGTKAICLNRGFARPGIVEIEFGARLRDVVREGGGARDGGPLDAVLLGGPMGSVLAPSDWDVPICYDAMAARRVRLGHGGVVALPAGTDWREILVHLLDFMRRESCGRCVPCAIGSQRAFELASAPAAAPHDRAVLADLLSVISDASLCAFGREAPKPLREILARFGARISGDGT